MLGATPHSRGAVEGDASRRPLREFHDVLVPGVLEQGGQARLGAFDWFRFPAMQKDAYLGLLLARPPLTR